MTIDDLVGELIVKGMAGPPSKATGIGYLGIASKDSNLAAFLLGMAYAEGRYGMEIDLPQARRMLERVVRGSFRHYNLLEQAKEEAKKKLEELERSS